jgi:hypothetical protein
MEQFIISASVTVNGETHTLGFDLNSISESLTEEKFEKCYMSLKPSMAKVLRDNNKITNPWGQNPHNLRKES